MRHCCTQREAFHTLPQQMTYQADQTKKRKGEREEICEKHTGLTDVSISSLTDISESVSHSVVSNSLRPHGLQPARLLCPWDSPGKNMGAGCHSLLQGIFLTRGSNLGLLHCRQILYCLSYRDDPVGKIRLVSTYDTRPSLRNELLEWNKWQTSIWLQSTARGRFSPGIF